MPKEFVLTEQQFAELHKIADYANTIANDAQLRLLRRSNQETERLCKSNSKRPLQPLYDDTFWQGVMDRVRQELLDLVAEIKQ
jgi:hypothetical protein